MIFYFESVFLSVAASFAVLVKLHKSKAETLPEAAVMDPVAFADALAKDERTFASGSQHVCRSL